MSVKVVIGPARSGKGTLLLSKIIAKIESNCVDETIILVPTVEIRNNLPQRIIKNSKIRAFRIPDITTFDGLAENVIRYSSERITKIGNLSSSFLIRQIARGRLSKGQLEEYESSAEYHGFYNYLIKFIYELKQSMIAPEDILENRQFESTEKRFQELVGVYSDYQAYLHEKRLYDDSGVFWRALEILQNSKSDFFSRYKTILIYGFTSFTYLQKRILRELIERIPEAVVFLDYEDDSDRKELFGDPCEILKFLQEFGPDIQRMSPNDNEWKYRHLERNLFRSRSEGDEVCSDFHLFHSPDSAMEIKAITTRIKDLIINEGCAPDDIALVIPKPELYANKIKSIFKEACIPYSLQSRQKIFDTPLGNYLSTFIGAAFADLSRAEFKMIVSSNYFLRFHENSLDNTENIKSDKEAVSVYLSNSAISMIEASDIRSGIDAWEQYFQTANVQIKDTVDRSTVGTLIKLICYLKKLRSAKDVGEAANILHQFLIKLKPGNLKDDYKDLEQSRLEISVFIRFRELFRRDFKLLEGSSALKGKESLSEILNFIMNEVYLSESGKAVGRVIVTNPYNFRGFNVKALLFAGLNRGSFPVYYSASDMIPFYKTLIDLNNEFKNRLPRQLDLAEDQMILFYRTLCSSSEYISLSWVQNDEESPSVFINDVLNIYPSIKVDMEIPAEIACQFARTTNMSSLLQCMILNRGSDETDLSYVKTKRETGDFDRVEGGISGKEAELGIKRFLDRSNIENLRESSAYPDSFDGMLKGSDVINRIKKYYHDDFQYTASMFSDFGMCPFMFLMKNILKLETPEEKTETGTPLDEGLFYHSVLQKFYSDIFSQDKAGDSFEMLLDIDTYLKYLDEVIDGEFRKIEKSSRVLTGSYWSITREGYRANIKRFVKFDLSRMGDFKPVMFEAGFGDVRKREVIDPGSISTPVQVIDESRKRKINLAGIIDRVDVLESEDKSGIRVIDYKSSGHSGPSDLFDGTDFQLQIYALAANELMNDNADTYGLISALYASIKKVTYKNLVELIDKDLKIFYKRREIEFSNNLKSYLFAYVDRIKAGFFPPFPNQNRCAWCKFRPLCRFNPRRILLKLSNNDFGGVD